MILKKKNTSSMLYAGISGGNNGKGSSKLIQPGEKKGSIKRKFVIGVTELKHGAGSSYTSIAIANFLRQYNKERVCVLHKECGYIEETLDDRADSIHYPCNMADIYANYDCIVYDGGVLRETDITILERCDIKIMMCWQNKEYERALYEFIKSRTDIDNWIFLFKEIPAKKVDYVYSLMEGYNTVCIPVFDASHLDKSMIDIFKRIFYE